MTSASGVSLEGTFGDKETAVRIRGNSHYRIGGFTSQVGMLIVPCQEKTPWVNGGESVLSGCGITPLAVLRPQEGAFLLSF